MGQKLKKIIKDTNTKGKPAYIELHGYKFALKLQ